MKEHKRREELVNKNIGKIERLLKEHAEQFLSKHYNMKLDIPIDINGRLSNTLGYFRHGFKNGERFPIKISISKRLVVSEIESLEELSDTVKDVLEHELIHYALFMKGLPYRDEDRVFIDNCKSLNVSLTETIFIKQVKNVYECKNGHRIERVRKLNTDRYVCGACREKLEYKGKEVV